MGIFSSDEFGYFEWQEEHQKVMKYKKALKDIKDIAEEVYNDEQIKFQASGVCYEILQKINEVENESNI